MRRFTIQRKAKTIIFHSGGTFFETLLLLKVEASVGLILVKPPGDRCGDMAIKPPQPRVLVVNSNPEIGSVIANVLGNEGFSVVVVEDGQAPLFKIATGDFSIVVLEKSRHREKDGIEIVRQARTYHPALKALYLSSRPDLMEDACELDTCLVAPFRLRELVGCTWELYYRGARSNATAVPRLDVELSSAARDITSPAPWIVGRAAAAGPAGHGESEARPAAAQPAATPITIPSPTPPSPQAPRPNADLVDGVELSKSRRVSAA